MTGNLVGLVVGTVTAALGLLGMLARFDDVDNSVRLYRQSGNVTAEQHRRGQRLGGALLVIGGLVFIGFSIYRLVR